MKAFGMHMNIKTGQFRRWYICQKTGVKRWADNDQPVQEKQKKEEFSMYLDQEVKLGELVGKTIKQITGLEKESEEVRVFTECGKEYLFHHIQDCCESVYLNDFDGDADDLTGALIVSAEEVSNADKGEKPDEYAESWTWTFYKIETNKGGIWMRWLGESNGWYSERVCFSWVNNPELDEIED